MQKYLYDIGIQERLSDIYFDVSHTILSVSWPEKEKKNKDIEFLAKEILIQQ